MWTPSEAAGVANAMIEAIFGSTKYKTDIPYRGPNFGEFLSVKPFIPLSQELQQMLVLVGQIEHEEPVPRDEEHMNPHKVVEDPPRGGMRDALAFLVGKGGFVILECLADTVL